MALEIQHIWPIFFTLVSGAVGLIIKRLFDAIDANSKEIQANYKDAEKRIEELRATTVTKEELTRHEANINHVLERMEGKLDHVNERLSERVYKIQGKLGND